MIYNGKVHKLGDHIDTDAIIPARYLTTFDPAELGKKCMAGLAVTPGQSGQGNSEDAWVSRVSPGDIMAAGRNFGCGSSREHAPVAILGAGIQVVVAHSFARIFYRNAFNRGLLLVEIGDAVNDIQDGEQLEIDTETGTIKIAEKDEPIKFPKLPLFIQNLANKGGLIPYVRDKLNAA